MAGETVRLAEYAAGLRYEDLPKEVVAAAKDAIIDTIAACICGSALPWSRIVIDYAERTGPGGASPHSGARQRGAGAGGGARQRRPRACLRARQPDPARRRRASRRDGAAAGARHRAAAGRHRRARR